MLDDTKEPLIHVCYSVHNPQNRKYSQITATSIVSLCENTITNVHIHILHDSTVSDEEIDKFDAIIKSYKQMVTFYNVDTIKNVDLSYTKNIGKSIIFSPATFYRFLICELFKKDIDRIIYLDSDTIVNLDILELWEINISDYEIAAVTDYDVTASKHIEKLFKDKMQKYFNAGVLLINLSLIRKIHKSFFQECIDILRNNNLRYYDQDVFNYIFIDKYFRLNNKFNVSIHNINCKSTFEKYIYHYFTSLPNLDKGIFIKLYRYYWKKTNWKEYKGVLCNFGQQ